MIVSHNTVTRMKTAQILVFALLSVFSFFPCSAQSVERKPPLHIKVKPVKGKKNQAAFTSCPMIIAGKSLNSKYGIKVNFIRQDRKALHLATALREYFFRKGRDTQFISALYDASVQTGTDFELLVLKAMMESNLGQLNFAKDTTARGSFQYIESTWLNLIKRYGKKAGYPDYAKVISLNNLGMPTFETTDEKLRQQILDLRFDPYVSALMKSYQMAEEMGEIRKMKNGRRVGATDHYIVHMLGLNLARKLYTLKNTAPKTILASAESPDMLAAAENNRVFFYDEAGTALNAQQVYEQFEKRVTAAQLRLANIMAQYGTAGGCGKFEPVPPYEAKVESQAAKDAKEKELNFTFMLTPKTEKTTPPQENKVCTPEEEVALLNLPESAAGEENENVPLPPIRPPSVP